MSSFIIIKNAQRSAKRRREEEERIEVEREALEKKMIKDGYVKKKIITNENYCFEHMYINPKKKKQGKILLMLAVLMAPLIVISFIFIPGISFFFYASNASFLVLFIMGYNKLSNTEIYWTSSKEPTYRKELYWESVKDVARYSYEWVKKGS